MARAARSLIRSSWRAVLLVGVLTVTVALGLTMITVDGAFNKRLEEIRAQAANDITIRPAGAFGGGFVGGGGGLAGGAPQSGPAGDRTATDTAQAVLHDTDVDAAATIAHVTGVTRRITLPYTGRNLVAAVPTVAGPGGPNQRNPDRPGGGGGGFARAILVTGTDDPARLTTLGLGQAATISSGRTFNEDESNANVALVGSGLAAANDLAVGEPFSLNDQTVTIVGLFQTETRFGDNSIFLPLGTARRIFDRTDEVDEATIRVDDINSIEVVAAALRTKLGDAVDVVTQSNLVSAISAPLSGAKNTSRTGMIVALVVSAAVILFAVGLALRQRVREIGVLKAVGASNAHVIGQFGAETAMMSVVAAVLGALVTYPLAQRVANGILSQPSVVAGPGGGARVGPGGFVRNGGGAVGRAAGLLGNVQVAVSPSVFLYAIAIAVGLALIATLVPTWYVSRVRPAEVLRHD